MHLVPGLVPLRPKGLVQATKSACGPIVDVASYRPAIGFLDEWARNCIEFNHSVFAFLSERPMIELVVLSSPFIQYVEDNARGLVGNGDQLEERAIDYGLAVEKFVATIRHIQALGKRVVIVSPTPIEGFDIGLCHERRLAGLITLGPYRECGVRRDRARSYLKRQIKLLSDVAAATSVAVVDLADYLCDQTSCRTIIDGTPLYWDAGHFSAIGSQKFMEATNVASAILREAR